MISTASVFGGRKGMLTT
jgi:antitoxin HigA-1